MKKKERELLANKLVKQIEDLGLMVDVEGYWIKLSPPSKVPVQLTTDVMLCADELTKILRNKL